MLDWIWLLALPIAVIMVMPASAARNRVCRYVLCAGRFLTVGSWLPLLSSVIFGWAGDNPVGLGLLAMFGSGFGLLLMGFGTFLRRQE